MLRGQGRGALASRADRREASLAGLDGLACPQEPLDLARIHALNARHYRRVVGSLLARYEPAIADASEGLIALVDGWLAGATEFETVWDPSFGRVRELLVPPPPGGCLEEGVLPPPAGDQADVMQRTAELALRLIERGHAGRFSVALGQAVVLRLGRWLLPPADALEVDSDGERARITARRAGGVERVELERSGDDWAADHARSLPVVDLGSGPVPIVSPTVEECRAQRHGHLPIDSAAIRPAIDGILAARDLLARYAPSYLPWVRRVVRQIGLVRAVPEGALASGSFLHRPGAVFLSSPMPVVVTAELLAHESAHLHFWMATAAGPCEDGTDRARDYFSPYVSKMRNLRMMLLTYHAFGNAVLFYRECRERGLELPPVGVERDREFASLLDEYERLLTGSPALRPLGRMLWESLANHVRRPHPAAEHANP